MEMEERLDTANQILADTKRRHEVRMMEQRSCYHMLDRMKKDLIALKIESNDLYDSLKKKELVLKEETERADKAKEQ